MSPRQNPGCGSKPTRRFPTHRLKRGRASASVPPPNPGCRFPGGSGSRTIPTFRGKRLEAGEDNFGEAWISKDGEGGFVERTRLHYTEGKTTMRPATPQHLEAVEA